MSGTYENWIVSSTRRYLVAGLLTVIPIWITWLIIDFLLSLSTKVGGPAAAWLAARVRPYVPSLSEWLEQTWFQSLMAVILLLVTL